MCVDENSTGGGNSGDNTPNEDFFPGKMAINLLFFFACFLELSSSMDVHVVVLGSSLVVECCLVLLLMILCEKSNN